MLRDVDSLSTYTDAGNATLNGDSIVEGFGAVLRKQFFRYNLNPWKKRCPPSVAYTSEVLRALGFETGNSHIVAHPSLQAYRATPSRARSFDS